MRRKKAKAHLRLSLSVQLEGQLPGTGLTKSHSLQVTDNFIMPLVERYITPPYTIAGFRQEPCTTCKVAKLLKSDIDRIYGFRDALGEFVDVTADFLLESSSCFFTEFVYLVMHKKIPSFFFNETRIVASCHREKNTL